MHAFNEMYFCIILIILLCQLAGSYISHFSPLLADDLKVKFVFE